MFSNLCSDFKVTFLIYLGWIVNSAMPVHLKFNILQNGTTNIYMKDPISGQILQPTNACQYHPHT